jgi:hypothetical protein
VSRPGGDAGDDDIAATMAKRAADAAAHAAEVMGTPLDHSIASLERVDEILARLGKDLPKGLLKWLGAGPSREELGIVCEMYGGYVGEILRREINGEWVLPPGGPYAGAPSIALGDELSSPVLKVWERITNPGATIPAYFAAMKQRWSGGIQ